MFDYEKIINSPIIITIYIHTKMHTHYNIHNINIHSYAIQISGPVGLFSNVGQRNKILWIIYRTSVGNILIVPN